MLEPDWQPCHATIAKGPAGSQLVMMLPVDVLVNAAVSGAPPEGGIAGEPRPVRL
jgi:hypothetical protein